MSDQSLLVGLYDRLMQTNREAFDGGFYSVAYHSLAAALQCARAMPDDQKLERIAEVATEQLVWIDQHAPDYEHSTPSAAQRGHKSIYFLLAGQARMTRQTRQVNRARENIEDDLTR